MQTKNKPETRRAKSRWAILLLAFIIFSIFVAKVIKIATSFDAPLNPELNTNRQQKWDGTGGLNILVKGSDMMLISIDPAKASSNIFNIPANMNLSQDPAKEAVLGVSTVHKYPELERSVTKVIGLPIDAVIALDPKSSTQDFLKDISSNNFYIKWISLTRSIRTDLSLGEVFKLFKAVSAVREDNQTMVDIAKSDVLNPKLTLSTDSTVIDSVKMDLLIRKLNTDSNFIAPGDDIAIYNSTTTPGLAMVASRLISNMGGRVSVVSNSETKLSKTVVIYSDILGALQGSSYTYNRLAEIFAPECLKTTCSVQDSKINAARAKFIVVLGEDFAYK